jgi:hypothetical protein
MNKINNIAVKSQGDEHGKRIITAFERLGVDTRSYLGSQKYSYYGVHGGFFDLRDSTPFGVEELTIEELEAMIEPKYPKMMLVGDVTPKIERNVIGEFIDNGRKYFIARTACGEAYSDDLCIWRYAKDIKPEPAKEVHLTLQDISEGKGVGVDPNLIRIKN